MTALIRYEAARTAVAECMSVDEVKAVIDKQQAFRLYAQMAKDRTMERQAAEIRIRAERRMGEIIKAQKEAGGLHKGGRPPEKTPPGPVGVSLSDMGISYNMSSRAQGLAELSDEEFEDKLDDWRARASVEGVRISAQLIPAGNGTADEQALAEGMMPPQELIEQLERELRAAHELLEVVRAEDPGAEAIKWKRSFDTAVRRCQEQMEEVKQRDKLARFLSRQLQRCGRAVGEEDPEKIPAAVERAVRAHMEAPE